MPFKFGIYSKNIKSEKCLGRKKLIASVNTHHDINRLTAYTVCGGKNGNKITLKMAAMIFIPKAILMNIN
jgi:hypothetical protein